AAPGGREPGARERGGAMPAPNAPAQNHAGLNSADQIFLTWAARCGAAQSDLAHLAEQRAGSPSVGEFARQMISNYDQTNRALRALNEGEAAPTLDQDAEFRQTRDALNSLSGAEFDIEYLRREVQAHQRMATLMEYVIGSGSDAQVQR